VVGAPVDDMSFNVYFFDEKFTLFHGSNIPNEVEKYLSSNSSTINTAYMFF